MASARFNGAPRAGRRGRPAPESRSTPVTQGVTIALSDISMILVPAVRFGWLAADELVVIDGPWWQARARANGEVVHPTAVQPVSRGALGEVTDVGARSGGLKLPPRPSNDDRSCAPSHSIDWSSRPNVDAQARDVIVLASSTTCQLVLAKGWNPT